MPGIANVTDSVEPLSSLPAIDGARHADTSPPVIAVRGVTARYGQFEILTELSFPIPGGMVHGLIGPNGAGKSTLLDVITGSHRPFKGSVHFDGQDISRKPAHVVARMGVRRTFQHPRLCWSWTLIENVMMGLPRLHGSAEQTSTRAVEALDRVGIRDQALNRADQADGVTQLRTQIARCLIAAPRVLVLDEPSAGMDQQQRGNLAALLLDLKESGVTVLLVAHDLQLIRACTDTVTVINAGRLIAHAPAEAALDDARVRAAYLGVASDV